ncbi:MAG: hypothetical protein AVDCRST_MAG41-247 [uncultured Corynebacteriales bacterium]|uniref:FAD-dependent urate hydroxylase HpyO/Asp monooxygenase CreE-like FAD/NAD(P)-binding domain-containing protein n=1 Tax=uncultured Mycobacteriales bacterium TaxID=581187 RepID=A0A6J4H781_9ACTN|nr:MAG: hypothetical protein AVDCRST_MAG41-247 [uncultured Corynebacteriales bacterium]
MIDPTGTGSVRFAIVGTGFAGTCTLWHLVQRLVNPLRPAPPSPVNVTIVTIEQARENGPGFAYAADNVEVAHRCNNQASTMAIHDDDFVDWMAASKPWLVRDHPELVLETHPGIDLDTWQPDGEEFYPRALFGLYLRQRFQETVERARRHGLTVEQYVRHEVVDGHSANGFFSLTVRSLDNASELRLDRLDRVVLSTGHWQPRAAGGLTGHPGYILSPYPPARMRAAVAERARCRRDHGERPRVFVRGMGPSGVDAIMSLCDEGDFTYTDDGHVASYRPAAPGAGHPPHVVAGSRSGFFPPVRGPLADYEMRYLTAERLAAMRREHHGYLRIEPILELLDADLRYATGGALGWPDVVAPPYGSAREKLEHDLGASDRNVVHTIVLKARRLRFYRHLTPSDKIHYDRTLDTHFIRTAVPLPVANGEKLRALLDVGVLSTVRLGYGAAEAVEAEDDGFRVTYRTGAGEAERLHVDCVVRAGAQDFAMHRHPSPLFRNLLRRGEILAHEEGGQATGGLGLAPGGGLRVLRQEGGLRVRSSHLASFGSPVRFWQNEHNFAAAFVEAAELIADDWLEAAVAAGTRSTAAGTDAVAEDLVGAETRR